MKDLYGANQTGQDNLYPQGSQPPQDEELYDPFASPAAHGDEPLFPAEPATTDAPTTAWKMPDLPAAPAWNLPDVVTPALPIPPASVPPATINTTAHPTQAQPVDVYGSPTHNAPTLSAPLWPSLPATQPTPEPATPATPAPKPTLRPHPRSNMDANFERHFAVILDLMQHGAWPQALEKLRVLQAEHPRAAFLEPLIEEAELKTDLMTRWSHKIKGRRLTVGQEWLLRRSLPFVVLAIILIGGVVFYQNLIAPSRQVVAMARANQARMDQASQLISAGRFQDAVALYEEVLTNDPENQAAHNGVMEARRQAGVAISYDIALEVAKAGNLPRALRILESIQRNSASFRDVDIQVNRLNALANAEQTFRAAERAYAQHRWLEAVRGLEQVKAMAADYRADVVDQHLVDAYFYAGQYLVTHWPTEGAGPEEARTYLRKAQAAGIQLEAVGELLDQLDIYFRGERALRSNNLENAINQWRGLYDMDSAYLGGYLAEQLYQAYLALGNEMRSRNDLEYAQRLYQLAAGLLVRDISEAQAQLVGLAAGAPAPTATPTPLPTATPRPVAAAPVAPAQPTPTPTSNYAGWIAFRSTRDGSEQIYIMRGDGSEAQRAPDEISSQLDALYQRERRATDGSGLVYVQVPSQGRSDANLYVVDSSGQNTRTLIDFERDQYDPVWSSNGQWIAFVSNHTGNDEVWVVRSDGSEPRQLTYNEWQWDKHPTWSPDSGQIAFFSNRTGQRQIWVMSTDGSNQRNLSNNAFDDWDPVWLK